MTPPAQIGVIADDFTGAVDCGIEFVRAGLETTLILSAHKTSPTAAQVVTTDSRDGDAATAEARTALAAEQLHGRRIFKKIDSTMRGHLAAEVGAILRVGGQRKAVVCPAAIEARRIVRDGLLWVGDLPLHQSDFAHDPRWPARSADMAALVGAPTTHLGRAAIDAGRDALAQAINSAPTAIVTVDACDHADLALVSEAILLSDSLPCGALGLARAWARCISGQTVALAKPTAVHGPILIIAGSRHPRTHAQLDALATQRDVYGIEAGTELDESQVQRAIAALVSGQTSVIRAPLAAITDAAAQRALVATLAELALRVCQQVRPGALMLTGGETASAVSHALGAAGMSILGEVEVGMPWGMLLGGVADGLLVATKAGGFGSDASLIAAIDLLRQQTSV